jgi:hypothetical protein
MSDLLTTTPPEERIRSFWIDGREERHSVYDSPYKVPARNPSRPYDMKATASQTEPFPYPNVGLTLEQHVPPTADSTDPNHIEKHPTRPGHEEWAEDRKQFLQSLEQKLQLSAEPTGEATSVSPAIRARLAEIFARVLADRKHKLLGVDNLGLRDVSEIDMEIWEEGANIMAQSERARDDAKAAEEAHYVWQNTQQHPLFRTTEAASEFWRSSVWPMKEHLDDVAMKQIYWALSEGAVASYHEVDEVARSMHDQALEHFRKFNFDYWKQREPERAAMDGDVTLWKEDLLKRWEHFTGDATVKTYLLMIGLQRHRNNGTFYTRYFRQSAGDRSKLPPTPMKPSTNPPEVHRRIHAP